MRHVFWKTDRGGKTTLSANIVKRYGRTILFCRTRRGVEQVGKEMKAERLDCSTLHGGLNQRQRDAAMARFKNGKSSVLIATDVAARGIDIEGVTCVIHFDPPENGKAYKHRSGRTARAGERGVVISFVQKSQQRAVNRIQREVGIKRRYTEPDVEALEEQESNREDEPNVDNSSQEKSAPRAHSFEWKNQRKGKNAKQKRPEKNGSRNSRKRSGNRPEKERPWEKNKRYNSKKKTNASSSDKSGKKKKKHFGNRPQKEAAPKHQRRNRKGRRSRTENKQQNQ
jgi:superfamily II DNA/RNA helicase